jgi:hypothetical protein
MKLHENKSLFQDAIVATSQQLNIQEIFVEKDYWVTVALHTIFHSDISSQAVFKGGTALSKCHKLIHRFSEDIDLVALRNEGESDAKMKDKIKKISKVLEAVMPEVNIEGITNKRGNIRKTVHEYNKLFEGDFGQVRPYIVLESTWLGNFDPYSTMVVSSYITEMMIANKQDGNIEEYNLQPFELNVLDKKRTFSEKIMSLVRFSNQEKPYEDLSNKIRHIYDLHMMLKNTEINDFFQSKEFDLMLIKVGEDDVIGYKSNNKWLELHPKDAIIFKESEKTWGEIKSTYRTTFKELVIGDLPKESDLVNTLLTISERLSKIEWTIRIE